MPVGLKRSSGSADFHWVQLPLSHDYLLQFILALIESVASVLGVRRLCIMNLQEILNETSSLLPIFLVCEGSRIEDLG